MLCANAMAQNNDPVIMTINGKNITRSEFEYSYNKNNSDGVIDKKSVKEYVPLYVDFKLKVAADEEARAAKAAEKEARAAAKVAEKEAKAAAKVAEKETRAAEKQAKAAEKAAEKEAKTAEKNAKAKDGKAGK